MFIGLWVDVSVAIWLILIRWHDATDVLGGAGVGLGATLLVDAALLMISPPVRVTRSLVRVSGIISSSASRSRRILPRVGRVGERRPVNSGAGDKSLACGDA